MKMNVAVFLKKIAPIVGMFLLSVTEISGVCQSGGTGACQDYCDSNLDCYSGFCDSTNQCRCTDCNLWS